MQLRKLRWAFVVVGILMISSHAIAEEEKKEGGTPSAPEPKSQREYTEKTSKMNSLATRIEEAEKHFQEAVRAKATEKNPSEKARLIKDLNEISKERNKSVEEYNKLKAELSLRYPNQGAHLDRHYQTQTKKSVEELEGAAGLDELLTRTKKIVEKKFAPFNEEADKKEEKVKVAQPEEEERKPLRLEK